MKSLFFTLIFLSGIPLLKSQSIIIYATEKIKSAEIPVERTDFEITINDTLKKKVTSQNDGSLPRISLPKGSYKVMLTAEEFNDVIEKEVVINESKTTELTIILSRKAQPGAKGK